MDRDEVVRISRLVAFGGLTGEDAANLLLDYCTEHGKDPKLSVTFYTDYYGNRYAPAIFNGSIRVL